MYDKKFDDGQALAEVQYEGGETTGFKLDSGGVKAITVIMENGQMAGVPWALVEYYNIPDVKINLAMCTLVRYAEKP